MMRRIPSAYLILLGFAIRLGIAVWNGFFGPSFGADMDAVTFHEEAVYYSNHLTFDEFSVGWIYSYVLGIVYHFIGDSIFVGSVFSCLAWLYSAILLRQSLRLMGIDLMHGKIALLLFALMPSSLLYTSVTMREAFQLMFVNLALYGALRIQIKNSISHWFVVFISVVGMGALHGALLAFGVLFVVGILAMRAIGRGSQFLRLAVVAPLIVVIIVFGASIFASLSYNLGSGLGQAIEVFQQNAIEMDARARYRSDISIDGLAGLLLFVPISLVQYLFEPFPWRALSFIDLPLVLENIVRAWLIWRALTGLFHQAGRRLQVAIFVFSFYVLLETTWAVGTLNWGTAARHHIPAMGLLLCAAFAYSRAGARDRLPQPLGLNP